MFTLDMKLTDALSDTFNTGKRSLEIIRGFN